MTPQIIEPSYSLPGIDRRLLVRWTALAALATVIGALVALLLLRDERMALVLAVTPLGALAVRFPRITCYVFVVLFPLTIGIPRGQFGLPGLRLGEGLLLAATGAVIAHAFLRRSWHFSFSEMDVAMFFLAVTGALIPWLVGQGRGRELSSDDLNTLFSPLKYYLVYRLVRAVVQSREHVHQIINLWFFASIVVAAIAVCESFSVPGVRDFLYNNYMSESTRIFITQSWRNPDLYRATSVFDGSWNTLGCYASFTIILAIYYGQVLRRRSSLMWLGLVVVLNSVALAITGNFASIGALAGSIIAGIVLLRRVPRAVILIVGGLLLTTVFFSSFIQARLSQQFGPSSDEIVLASTFTARLSLWSNEFLPALHGNYVFGIGPELPDEVWWGTEESQYIYLLFKGGILYILSFIVWIVLGARMSIRAINSGDSLAHMLGLAALCMLLSLLVMGISNAYATYTAPMGNLWILLTIISCTSHWIHSESDDAQ